MGGPKALLTMGGELLVAHHAARFRAAGCKAIVVVVPPGVARDVHSALGPADDVRVVPAVTHEQAASLTIGLRSLPREAERAIFVTPVDLLPPRLSTLATMLAAVQDGDVHVVTPELQGRSGHPVLVRESLLRPFLEGFPGSLRDLLSAADSRRRRVAVDDPAVVGDLDTPAALREAAAAHGVAISLVRAGGD